MGNSKRLGIVSYTCIMSFTIMRNVILKICIYIGIILLYTMNDESIWNVKLKIYVLPYSDYKKVNIFYVNRNVLISISY